MPIKTYSITERLQVGKCQVGHKNSMKIKRHNRSMRTRAYPVRGPDIFPQGKELSVMNKMYLRELKRNFYFKRLTLNWARTEEDLLGNKMKRVKKKNYTHTYNKRHKSTKIKDIFGGCWGPTLVRVWSSYRKVS